MPLFSSTVTSYWQATFSSGNVVLGDNGFTVAITPDLDEEGAAMVLRTADGRGMAAVTPALSEKLALSARSSLSEPVFRQMLLEAGITLHDADYLYYFAEAEKLALLEEQSAGLVRLLTVQDAAAFAEFQSSASAEDLDAAYVELDHWTVFGAFEDGRLVCAASMWQGDSRLADLGVLTLATHRGKGHARGVVRAISRYALEKEYEPQYRCQLHNHASATLAKATGMTLFGEWEPVSPASDS